MSRILGFSSKDLVANDLMKCESVVIDDQSFDTKRDFAIDFAKSFKSISEVRSIGKDKIEFETCVGEDCLPFSSSCCSIFAQTLT